MDSCFPAEKLRIDFKRSCEKFEGKCRTFLRVDNNFHNIFKNHNTKDRREISRADDIRCYGYRLGGDLLSIFKFPSFK